MKQEKWTKDLQDRLADYEMPAPEGLWEEIESALPKPKARTRQLRRWAAAAAIGALLVGGGAFFWLHDREDVQQMAEMKEAKSPEKPDYLESPKRAEFPESPEKPTLTATLAASPEQNTASPLSELPESSPIEAKPSTDNNDNEPAPTKPHKQQPAQTATAKKPQNVQQSSFNAPRPKRTITVGLLVANIASGNGSMTQEQVLMSKPFHMAGEKFDLSDAACYHYANSYNVLNDYDERAEHHQPLQVGMTARYAIDDHWALESGIIYSRMTSDFTRQMPLMRQEDHQTLHYIGIPVNVNYRIWKAGNVSVYASAGAEADMNVKATLETDGVKRDMRKDKLQLSANAAIGAQYQITQHVGAYLQPGMQYYFDNGSSVQNYFKDKPLGFSLQFGVRVDVNNSH